MGFEPATTKFIITKKYKIAAMAYSLSGFFFVLSLPLLFTHVPERRSCAANESAFPVCSPSYLKDPN